MPPMSLYYSDIAPLTKALEGIDRSLSVLAAVAALPQVQGQVRRYTPGGNWDEPEMAQSEIDRLNKLEAREERLLQTIRGFQP